MQVSEVGKPVAVSAESKDEVFAMFRTFGNLSSYQLGAVDRGIGTVHDFYVDDEHWALRYLGVDTGKWPSGQHVLASPMAIETVDWRKRPIVVNLTRDQIRNGPGVETAGPVSRQYQIAFNTYFGYPPYWPGPGIWAWAPYPSELARGGNHCTPATPDLNDAEHSQLQRERGQRLPHPGDRSGDRTCRGLRTGR
jgi:hypothetical protein